jgi:DNA-binding transcriptional ArsR family regulator
MPRRRPADPVFAALSDTMRRIIFDRLSRKPQTAGELAHELPVTRSAVVQHLKVLERRHLVASRPDGVRKIYSIDPAGLAPLRAWLEEHLPKSRAE